MDSHRERYLQACVEGRIDEDELRRRVGTGAGPDSLAEQVAAYRLVYEALAEEPEFSLSPDFAERVARAATPERAGEGSWAGGLAMAALLVTATGVAVAIGIMAVQMGPPLEASPAVSTLRTLWESLRPDLIGAVLGSVAVLAAADGLASRLGAGGRRTTAGV